MLLRAASSRMFCCAQLLFRFRDQLLPRAGELPRAPGQEAVGDRADQAHAEHGDGGGATASASVPGESPLSAKASIGSGTISTAPIAVK